MRVALYVSRHEGEEVQTPPSLQYLAGYLVGNGLVGDESILFADSAEDAIAFEPDILGVGSVSQCVHDAVRVARAVRSAIPECWAVLGGYHISALPQTLPWSFDVGVIGEGEVTFAELVSLRTRSREASPELLESVEGICFRDKDDAMVQTPRRPLIADIDSLPPPLRRLPYGQPWPYLFTARGCPYRCSYCASHAFWERYRYHSAQYVVDEISRLVADFGVTSIYSVDDLFIAPKERLREMRRLLDERGLLGKLRFKGFGRVNLVDEEVVRILKEIGFVDIRFGMETASERLLKQIKDHPFTIEQADAAVDLCNRYGIHACGSFMFGIPGEEEEDINASRRFLRRHAGRFAIAGFYLIQPVPGTLMWDECLAAGLVSPDMDFSSMELDMTKEHLDWGRVLYLNEERIPLPRFRQIMDEIRKEFVTPTHEKPETPDAAERPAPAPSLTTRALWAVKHRVKLAFRRLGYDIQRVRPKPPKAKEPPRGEKVTGARLYIGCGEDSREGFVGCDMRALPNVSVVCKAWQVSQHCAELLEIYSRHMLEHLTFDEVVATLRDWHQALAVGGNVEIVVPNLGFHIDQWQRAEWNEGSLRDKESDARWGFAGLYGWQRQCNPHARDYDASYWDVHKSGYNEELIRFLLRRVGFCDVEIATRDEAHLVARATKRLDHRERQIAPSVGGIRADHRGRYEFAARLVPHWGRVLDVGCGVGYGAHIVSDRTLALEILAMDIDEEAIAYAQEFHGTPKVCFKAGDVLEAELHEGRYDVAVAFEVIEHMRDPSRLLQRLRKAIRPDGCLVCSTPNEDRLPFDLTGFPFHVRHYTPNAFTDLLEAAGFTVSGLYSQHSRDSAEVREGSDGLYVIAVCTAGAAEPEAARGPEGDGDGGE